MKRLAAAALAALAACSTPASRIKDKREVFASYPAEIQEKIKRGEAAVGFTYEQVELAMGRPDRRYSGSSEQGSTETWVWTGGGGGTGVGLSVGAGSVGPTIFGGGITIGGAPAPDERARVVFRDGRAVSVERRER